MGKILNLIGQKYNRLLVINFIESKKYHRRWKCLCDCGNYITVPSGALRCGNTKSCGCLFKEKSKTLKRNFEPGLTGMNRLYCDYKKSARQRKLDFSLNKEDFKNLTSNNCHYCNSAPRLTITSSAKSSPENKIHSRYTYNGIDRKDNKKGYFIENCVSCCVICNIMKKSLSYEDFLYKIREIYDIRANNRG